ncbi:MAG: HlyD family efflux transporter periplasmic adaptor subunit [Bacteroidetes bacterium]|nr:HlyD family efflux transporter periplasmic adaptor subunit [Bacteroidota bacterium]
MKPKYYLLIAVALLAACTGRNDRSDAYGNFEAVEVTISAEASGKILALEVTEGQTLDSAQPIGVIDSVDLVLKRQQLVAQQRAVSTRIRDLDAQTAVMQQQLENMKIDQIRMEKMFADGAATKKQVDDLIGSMEVIRKQIESVETQKAGIHDQVAATGKQIEQVSESVRKCRIVSPIRGTVLAKYAEKGEVTIFGKPLFKMANLDVMTLKVYVSGDQLHQVKIGREVDVLYDKGPTELGKTTGIISWISPTAEFTPKTIQTRDERINLVYSVKVRIKNDGTFKIGMPGEIRFKEENKTSTNQ